MQHEAARIPAGLREKLSPAPSVRCREIRDADVETIIDLLTRAFRAHRRSRAFWVNAIGRLSTHATPLGFPKYGYMLESEGRAVGVLLLIFSTMFEGEKEKLRGNGSSLYVEPAFRCYTTMLTSRALRYKHVTYLNISPSPHTLPMIEAQGYVQYSSGRFFAIAALSTGPRGCTVSRYSGDAAINADLPSADIDLLANHASYGCISLICHADRQCYPFVFAPWRRYGLRLAYLVYCGGLDKFSRFAGPLGRYLLRIGFPLVIADANGPLQPLIGIYSEKEPKFFRGPHPPRLGDLAYSERAMFGV
jgi:hypothetical protein